MSTVAHCTNLIKHTNILCALRTWFSSGNTGVTTTCCRDVIVRYWFFYRFFFVAPSNFGSYLLLSFLFVSLRAGGFFSDRQKWRAHQKRKTLTEVSLDDDKEKNYRWAFPLSQIPSWRSSRWALKDEKMGSGNGNCVKSGKGGDGAPGSGCDSAGDALGDASSLICCFQTMKTSSEPYWPALELSARIFQTKKCVFHLKKRI